MNIYKLKPESTRFREISVQNYEEQTLKRAPYYQIGSNGKMRHYAVCPACDNPIQIIGIGELPKNTDKPYGKHFVHSVKGVAEYSQAAFDACPLAVRNLVQPAVNDYRPGIDPIVVKIIDILRREFDRIAMIFREDTGIVMTEGLARNMLRNYLAEEGYLYRRASLINIPWVFALKSDAQSLVGRIIYNEDLKQALNRIPNATFSRDQLVKRGNQFLNVNFSFMHHRIALQGNSVQESMRFTVWHVHNNDNDIVYEKNITFNYERFQYLMDIPEGMGARKTELLNIAAEMLERVGC